jgi:stage V sporulation protein AD
MRKRIINLKNKIYFHSYGAVGGYEERRGPLGELFDFCDESDKFGQKTWELAEGEMSRLSLNFALSKGHISHEEVDFLIAGDLQNQCVASSIGLSSFSVPFLGVYGACSTCTESLLIASLMLQSEDLKIGAAVTSSHNSAAERQFRTPIEYGGQRTKTAQWTATAAGSFILKKEPSAVMINEVMVGKIISGETTDGSNMGGAMAFSAADTIISYFNESGAEARDFDLIVTGDLGKVGSSILRDILAREKKGLERLHTDCGLLLYDDKKQDVHSGASGCGTSASVLATYFLPRLESGKLKNILFLSTGALMSPSSLLQGKSIFGIAPLIKLSHNPKVQGDLSTIQH